MKRGKGVVSSSFFSFSLGSLCLMMALLGKGENVFVCGEGGEEVICLLNLPFLPQCIYEP